MEYRCAPCPSDESLNNVCTHERDTDVSLTVSATGLYNFDTTDDWFVFLRSLSFGTGRGDTSKPIFGMTNGILKSTSSDIRGGVHEFTILEDAFSAGMDFIASSSELIVHANSHIRPDVKSNDGSMSMHINLKDKFAVGAVLDRDGDRNVLLNASGLLEYTNEFPLELPTSFGGDLYLLSDIGNYFQGEQSREALDLYDIGLKGVEATTDLCFFAPYANCSFSSDEYVESKNATKCNLKNLALSTKFFKFHKIEYSLDSSGFITVKINGRRIRDGDIPPLEIRVKFVGKNQKKKSLTKWLPLPPPSSMYNNQTRHTVVLVSPEIKDVDKITTIRVKVVMHR